MNGKQLAVILAIIGAAAVLLGQQTTNKVSEFESWKAKHGVSYASEFENAYRERIFLENLAKINTHNSNEHKSYEMGLNQFSALTQEEFAMNYLGFIPDLKQNIELINQIDDVRGVSVNWTTAGAVTRIKNQGQCGSCWAFSATGGLEGLSKIAYGQLQSFSEQQLVDCDRQGNKGCDGGGMVTAFKYVKAHGIVHEDDYKYEAKQQTCLINEGPFKISGSKSSFLCSTLANEIKDRPISVAVDATNWSPYKSGVFNNCKTSMNHGVLLAGVEDDFWWIKNSWGTSWGENGYIKLARGNTCGVCLMAAYPVK